MTSWPHPHGLSHAVVRQLQAAVDHLDAVRVLIVEAQKIHNAAPFTLTRGALETAAAAVWMLSPSNRKERVLHCLRHMVRDAIDADQAATGMGLTTHKPLAQRRAEINERAREITGLPNLKVGPETSTNIVKVADAAAGLTLDALSAWRACSGFAHGRLWATLSVLEKEELPGAEDGMHRLRVTTPLDRVFWVVLAATDLTDHGFNLLRKRSAALLPVADHAGNRPITAVGGQRVPIRRRRGDVDGMRTLGWQRGDHMRRAGSSRTQRRRLQAGQALSHTLNDDLGTGEWRAAVHQGSDLARRVRVCVFREPCGTCRAGATRRNGGADYCLGRSSSGIRKAPKHHASRLAGARAA